MRRQVNIVHLYMEPELSWHCLVSEMAGSWDSIYSNHSSCTGEWRSLESIFLAPGLTPGILLERTPQPAIMLVEMHCTVSNLSSDDILQSFRPTGGGIDSLQTAGVAYKPNMLIHRGCNVDTDAKTASRSFFCE